MRNIPCFGLAVLAGLILTACQSTPNPAAVGSGGVAYQSGTQRRSSVSLAPAETWSSESWMGEARHPNRATREPQYIPN
jgi:hypothetical protein